MQLIQSTEKLKLIAGSAADLRVSVSLMRVDGGTPPVVQPIPNPGPIAAISAAGTFVIVDGTLLTAGHAYNLKHCSVKNEHASQSTTVELDLDTNVSPQSLIPLTTNLTLLAGEALVFTQGGVWLHYDSNMGVYPSVGNAASQAEMEAGTATDKYVTPQGVKWHPGAVKVFCKTKPGNVNSSSYNVSGVDDTTAGITTITFATGFATADYACVPGVESTSDTLTVTNLKIPRIGLADQAAGSVKIECHDVTAITAVIEDPTAWHIICAGDFA